MSEPLSPTPGGPMPRPDGNGLPPNTGGEGLTPGSIQGGDSRDPGLPGDGDIGPDVGAPGLGGVAGAG